jgi:shikimate kinase
VLNADNRRLIESSGTVVWLRAQPETLAARVGDGAGRPLLEEDPSGAMVRLFGERAPYYAEVADAVVDVEGLTVAAVADCVLAAAGLEARTGAPPRRADPTALATTPPASEPPSSAPA